MGTTSRRLFTIALATLLVVAGGVVLARNAVAPAGATTVAGCTGASPGSTTLTPTIDGHVRTVVVHVPRGSTNNKARALVLNMHGSGSDALDQELFSGMDRSSNQDGFIVVYPQGSIPSGSGFAWNVPHEPLVGGGAVPKGAPSDVKFLTQLVKVLEGTYCVNPREVYATGFSGGARMASQLGCDSSNVFAAVAPVSGLRRPTPCPTSRAVPVLSFHGSADPVDPFAGHGQKYWTYSVPSAAAKWAAQDGCAAKPFVTSPATTLTLSTYRACRDGAAVELYELTGEGHEWPDGPTLPPSLTAVLGPQSNALDANQTMWTFFEAHPLSKGATS